MKVFTLPPTQENLVLSDTAVAYVKTVQASYGLPTFGAALAKIIRDHAKQAEQKMREKMA